MSNDMDPIPIGPSPPWVTITGAVFGAITLIGFFAFAYLAGTNPRFICNAFALLAAIFALGPSLAAGFIGGAAAVRGTFGSAAKENAIVFAAGGGVGVLFISLWAFNTFFHEQVCVSDINDLKIKISEKESSIKALAAEIASRDQKLAELSRIHHDLKNPKQITIVVKSTQAASLLLKQMLITYTGKSGPRVAIREPGSNVFKIPRGDLDDDDPGIYLTLDEKLVDRPTDIVIERLDHQIDPLRINLTLQFNRQFAP